MFKNFYQLIFLIFFSFIYLDELVNTKNIDVQNKESATIKEARIDDDEEWTINHIEKLVEYADKNNYEFVSGNVEIITKSGKTINKGQRLYSKYFKNENKNIPENKNPRLSGHSTWLYRSYLKHFKYNSHCWRKNYNRVNDIDLALRFLKAGVRIGNLDETVTYLKTRPGEDDIGWAAVSNK